MNNLRLITNIKIKRRKPASHAFITFKNEADADNAINEFKEKPLRVERPNNSSRTKVFVGNLPLDVSKEAIKELFHGIEVNKGHKEAAFKYSLFIYTGLHVDGKAKNPQKTIIVYAIGNNFNKCIVHVEESGWSSEESRVMHAEENMIKHLEEYVKKNKVTDVYVYLSYSPCHDCAIKLESFSKKRRIKFAIHFVGLYRCYRKSCSIKNCCEFEDRGNEDAVRNLNSNDQFKMSTFAPETWDTLRFSISTYYKQQMEMGQMKQMALQDSILFQMRYLLIVNDTFKKHQIEREKEDQHMKSDLEHLLNATSENQHEGEAEHDRTSDNEDQEGQSGSGNGGGSSKEETDKSEDQDDDDDKRVNRNQPKPKNQERQSNYQINDNPSSSYESDSSFDSSIWDMLNAYEESKEFQDINKNITMKHNKYTTNKTQDKQTFYAHKIASDTDATDALNDDESDSAFDSWIWDEINAYEDSKEFKNIEKNFTKHKCIVKPNSVSSKKQKKHGVTKKTEQFRSHAPPKRCHEYTSRDNRRVKIRLPPRSDHGQKSVPIIEASK